MRDFRELKVWEKAHQLALRDYKATITFPSGDAFGITSQMRRAAVSVPANIAEGCGRRGDAALDTADGCAAALHGNPTLPTIKHGEPRSSTYSPGG